MGGGERVPYDLAERQRSWGQQDEAETADQGEVFQELPEMFKSLAFLETPEIRKAPELVKQHRCYDAETRQDEGGKPVMPSCDDADRCNELDNDGGYQHGWLVWDVSSLFHGGIPVQYLVEAAERKKRHQANTKQQRRIVVDQRHWLVSSQKNRVALVPL